MAAGIHGSARTKQRIRAELQASTRKLSARYGLNVKIVAKWRSRTTTTDKPMGPTNPRCAHLSKEEEAMVVEFRRRTLLPLDDLLGHLREAFPQLTRGALHRCLIRHGISKRRNKQQNKNQRGQFEPTEMGYLHIDSCELRLEEGRQYMFLAIDRVTKFSHVAFFDASIKQNEAAFLEEVVAVYPYTALLPKSTSKS